MGSLLSFLQGSKPLRQTIRSNKQPISSRNVELFLPIQTPEPAYMMNTPLSTTTSPYVYPPFVPKSPDTHLDSLPCSPTASSVTIVPTSPHNDSHPFPTVVVECTARSTDSTKFPSHFLYLKDETENPIVREGMKVRLWNTEEPPQDEFGERFRQKRGRARSTTSASHVTDHTELEGFVAGIRGLDKEHIEFWVIGVVSNITCFAVLIVPKDRAAISRPQLRLHRFVRTWLPQTVDNAAKFDALRRNAADIRTSLDQGSLSTAALPPICRPQGPPPFLTDFSLPTLRQARSPT